MRLIDADALTRKILSTTFTEKNMWALNLLLGLIEDAPTVGGWIGVKDRMPVETHSIFYQFYGTKKWSNAMWREQSDKVLVTVAFKDGTKIVTTGETHDGVWHTTISRTLEPDVTHWMPLPEPPEQ